MLHRIAPFITSLAVALLLAGCGSDAPTDTGNNNTNQPGPPASVAATAGNGQEAPVGSPVAIAPSVVVKDASGRTLSGIQVNFTVQSGGGSLAGSSATTGSNGVATAGTWTLGVNAGVNTLSASVSGLAAVTFSATAQPAARVVATGVLAVTGGTITVVDPGGAANGVALKLPPNSFSSATSVTIASLPSLTLSLPSGVSTIGPLLQVSGFPATEADSLIAIRIPVTAVAGRAIAAFIRNPNNGRLESLSPIARDAASITVATRHLSPDRMLSTRPLGAAAMTVGATAGPVQLLLLEVLTSKLNEGIDTQFRPEVDGWEFENKGSYLAPGGNCAGQSITALWYFLRAKVLGGPLFGKLDTYDTLQEDNPFGYRFASVVQSLLDWDTRNQYFDKLATTSTIAGLSADALHFQTVAIAMLATGEPQYVAVRNAHGGHALVAYRLEANRILVSDPNFPGQSRQIDFMNGSFNPYPSRPMATEPDELYTQIRTVGTSVMIPTGDIDALWPQVQNGTIGNGRFPDYVLEYFNLLDDDWKPLSTPLSIRQSETRFRVRCPLCVSQLAAGKLQWIVAFDGTGLPVGNGNSPAGQGADGMTVPVSTGPQSIGLFIRGAPDANHWSYLDFKWIQVIGTPFSLEPATVEAQANADVTFTARPHGNRPPSPRYVFDFGDGKPKQTVNGDSTVTHKYTTAGEFTASVEMFDNASGARLARAESPVVVNDTVVKWRLTKFLGVAPVWTPVNVGTRGEFDDFSAFFFAAGLHPETAEVHFFNRPAGGPVSPSVNMFVTPAPPGGFTAVSLGRNGTVACPEGIFLVSTGTVSNGTLQGQHIRVCTVGTPASLAVVRMHMQAQMLGDKITGTITATYNDYNKVNLVITLLETKVVVYTFEGTRVF